MPTVLIVDDYPAVRKTLRSLLEKLCSVMCIEASNGLDAIAKAEVLRPDLIILDLGMPEMNGVGIRAVFSKSTDINALVAQASELLRPSQALA